MIHISRDIIFFDQPVGSTIGISIGLKWMQAVAEATATTHNKRKKPDADSDVEGLDVAEVLNIIKKLKKK